MDSKRQMRRLLVFPLLLSVLLPLFAGCGKSDQANGKDQTNVQVRQERKRNSDK